MAFLHLRRKGFLEAAQLTILITVIAAGLVLSYLSSGSYLGAPAGKSSSPLFAAPPVLDLDACRQNPESCAALPPPAPPEPS